MYYWDGQAWRSALSPDGRFRWDGAAWTPVGAMAATPYGFGPPQREPTSWTKPLQLAVAGWYVWSILFTLAEPFWAGGMMGDLFNQSIQRQQQVNPEVSPPPAEFVNAMTGLMTATMWVVVVIYAAIFAVIIVGTWKRWVWMYYVVLVLLGLTSLLVPVQVLDAFITPSLASSMGMGFMSIPAWLYPLAIGTGVLAIGLFVWMLVALVKRGPWAMRRPALWG
jgi:uncharacterized membrane protein (DUF2068 family)